MKEFRIVVYSDDALIRRNVLAAIGDGNRSALRIRCVEVATAAALEQRMAAGEADLAILDAEATPVGGLGLARQLKDEIDCCPVLMVLIGRCADIWLARWSGADAVLTHPLDPMEVARVVVALLRDHDAVQREWRDTGECIQ